MNSGPAAHQKKGASSRQDKKKVRCACCQALVSPGTALRHRKVGAAPHVRATSVHRRRVLLAAVGTSDDQPQSKAKRIRRAEEDQAIGAGLKPGTVAEGRGGSPEPSMPGEDPNGDEQVVQQDWEGLGGNEAVAGGSGQADEERMEPERGSTVDSAEVLRGIRENLRSAQRRTFPVTVEDCEDDEDALDDPEQLEEDEWGNLDDEDDDDVSMPGPELSARDQLYEMFMKRLSEIGEAYIASMLCTCTADACDD